MQRFANPALRHRTRQIAADGSQKLPQRLLAPMAKLLDRSETAPALTLAVAAWMAWGSRRDACGAARLVEDPLATMIERRLAGVTDTADQVSSLLSIREIVPPSLAERDDLRSRLKCDIDRLRWQGSQVVMVKLCGRQNHDSGSRVNGVSRPIRI